MANAEDVKRNIISFRVTDAQLAQLTKDAENLHMSKGEYSKFQALTTYDGCIHYDGDGGCDY